jgi:hypothetical protein
VWVEWFDLVGWTYGESGILLALGDLRGLGGGLLLALGLALELVGNGTLVLWFMNQLPSSFRRRLLCMTYWSRWPCESSPCPHGNGWPPAGP